ncbi:SGNH/GDSL hydrolase family protein [Amycolatopsis magusensis]|uniref:SGNH/GDSL hydrolase family protein n=1 Tax=Amycolatopsis magusensis TaxID=882444 RepID=UPI003C2AD67D
MKSHRDILTPQMPEYSERLYVRGTVRWLPYLMYFQPAGHDSPVVRTDRLGFRLSHGSGAHASAGGHVPDGPVNVLAGNSAVFGTGATRDEATLPSRLWTKYAPSRPWLNFGGRSYNATQELLLFTLHRHLVPEVAEIVVFSGFNTLALARLPASQQGENGAFFRCTEFFAKTAELGRPLTRAERRAARQVAEPVPAPAEQLANAAELTLRQLATWRLLAGEARLTFVLQPLAPWVRERPAPQERLLFDELDERSDFTGTYAGIATPEAGRRYADALRTGCASLGVRFLDFNPVLAAALEPDDWVFVDRIHFTDEGHDLVAGLLATELSLT